jgi:hypothetical protein
MATMFSRGAICGATLVTARTSTMAAACRSPEKRAERFGDVYM